MIRFSQEYFPLNAGQRKKCALPWGMTVEPFYQHNSDDDNQRDPLARPSSSSSSAAQIVRPPDDVVVAAEDVARCDQCLAYINYLAQFSPSNDSWQCPLCRTWNRCGARLQQPSLPELSSSGVVDLLLASNNASNVPGASAVAADAAATAEAAAAALAAAAAAATTVDDEDPTGTHSAAVAAAASAAAAAASSLSASPPPPDFSLTADSPVYVGLVDLTLGGERLDDVKQALVTMVRSLPANGFFGLATFSSILGLYTLGSSEPGAPPHVKYVELPEAPDQAPELNVRDVLSLREFLAPVACSGQAIERAIDRLNVASASHHARHRATGAASRMLVEFLSPAGMNYEVFEVNEGNVHEEGKQIEEEEEEVDDDDDDDDEEEEEEEEEEENDSSFIESLLNPLFQAFSSFTLTSSSSTSSHGTNNDTLKINENASSGSIIEPDCLNARLSIFLGGRPNYGPGAVSGEATMRPETEFYARVADRALASCVTIDLYLVGPPAAANSEYEFYGLPSLQVMATATGGVVLHYGSAESRQNLAQDVHRTLTRAQCCQCLLRVRTSPEFHVVNQHGSIYPSPDHAAMYVAQCVTEGSCFGFNFGFNDSDGFSFSSSAAATPVVQIVFSYARLDQNGKLVRYIRIITKQAAKVAGEPIQLFQSADPEVCLYLVAHQVFSHCLTTGSIESGRLLLQEWLAAVFADYEQVREGGFKFSANSNSNKIIYGPGWLPDIDVSFVHCPSLRPLPRLIFAFSRSSALKSHNNNKNNFPASLSQCYLYQLSPTVLRLAIYPRLLSFSGPNNLSSSDNLLNAVAVKASANSARYYLIDGYDRLVVFRTALGEREAMALPPARATLLRETASRLAHSRPFYPRVIWTSASQPHGHSTFRSLLVEEGGPKSPMSSAPSSSRWFAPELSYPRFQEIAIKDTAHQLK